jgi:hypothetical protein
MTANTNLSPSEYKVLWVVGSLERLATLKLLDGDIPLRLSQDALDDYLIADEHRQRLFNSDFEVAEVFSGVSMNTDTKPEDCETLIQLLIEYKNTRTELVKYALECEFS